MHLVISEGKVDEIIGLTVSMYTWGNSELSAIQLVLSYESMFLVDIIETVLYFATCIMFVLSFFIFRKSLILASGVSAGIISLMNLVRFLAAPTVGNLFALVFIGVYVIFAFYMVRSFDKIQSASTKAVENKESRS